MAEPKAAGPITRRVRGDGLDLAVRTWGEPSAPTVLLVHGFPDTSAVWEPVAGALAARGLHVAAYDVRGAGASDAPTSREGYDLDHLIADLAAVADEVSPDRPVHLVGHDWGAIQSWHAVGDPNLAERIASFTSISGLPLDQVGRWIRAEAGRGHVLRLLRQGVRSSYVAWFHLPGLQRLLERVPGPVARSRRGWAALLRRVEGAAVDDGWPAPTFATDVARGMQLYRANVRRHLRHPAPPQPTTAPVLLVLPTKDRFVPEWFFEGIEAAAPNLRRERIAARHWVVRSRPDEVAALVAEQVAAVEGRSGGAAESVGPAARGQAP